jgi:anti-sigma regulatory factor (Ser/Thr protein kinase)
VAAAEHTQRAVAHLHLVLHAGTGAVRAARRAVQEWAGDRGATTADQHLLALLTTEVVSNAVRHGPADGEVELAAAQERGQFVVRVGDASRDLPVLRRQPPEAVGGRGVQIIDHLATDWGVERCRGGKVVWFRVRPGRTARGAADARGPR